MRAVFPDFLSGEIVVNADGSVRIAFAQNAAGDGDACFVAVHFKTLVQHSAARVISVDGIFLAFECGTRTKQGNDSQKRKQGNGFHGYAPMDFQAFASARQMAATNHILPWISNIPPFSDDLFSFRGRLKASKQPDFKLLCFYPLYIPLTAFTDPTTGVPDLPARL